MRTEVPETKPRPEYFRREDREENDPNDSQVLGLSIVEPLSLTRRNQEGKRGKKGNAQYIPVKNLLTRISGEQRRGGALIQNLTNAGG